MGELRAMKEAPATEGGGFRGENIPNRGEEGNFPKRLKQRYVICVRSLS